MKINREPISIQIANRLEKKFLCRYKDGESIPPIQEICDDFEVSRSVVREALKILETRGLLDIQKGKQATIKPISSNVLVPYFMRICAGNDDSFYDLIDILQVLEQKALNCIEKADEADFENIRYIRNEIVDSQMGNEFLAAEEKLHKLIAGLSGNTILIHLTVEIRYAIKNILFNEKMSRYSQAQFEEVKKNYVELCDAIISKDSEIFKSKLSQHYEDVRNRFEQTNI